MRYVIKFPAGENEKFAPDAFNKNIGKRIGVNLEDGSKRVGTIVGVEVDDSGDFALIDLEY